MLMRFTNRLDRKVYFYKMYTTLYYRNVFLLYSFFFVQFFSGCHFQSCKKAVASILVNCATMHMQINSSSRQTRRKISVWEVFLSCSINKCMALSRLYFHFIKREEGKNTRTFWLIWPLYTMINNSVVKEKTCVSFFGEGGSLELVYYLL